VEVGGRRGEHTSFPINVVVRHPRPRL